jgi:fructose-1,6-bisphosphatase/sedoheptulose 1,7-bisphosphatase-like protein
MIDIALDRWNAPIRLHTVGITQSASGGGRKGILHAPDTYMEKIAVGPGPEVIDLCDSVS